MNAPTIAKFLSGAVVLWAVTTLGSVFGQESSPPPEEAAKVDKGQVLDLLKMLDSPVFQQREKALKKLRTLGRPILPTIKATISSLSLNARMQLQPLLDENEAPPTPFAVKLEATIISVPKGETPVGEILALLTGSAGFRFLDRSGIDSKTPVFFEGGKLESLKILNRLCNKLGVRWAQDFNTGAYRFYRGATTRAPVEVYRGPYHIALNSLAINTNLQFGSEPTANCYLRGQLDIEPLADVVGILFQPEVVAALDDQKRNLRLESKLVQHFQSAVNRRNFNFNLRISLPEKDAKTIGLLHLRIPIILPQGFETVTIRLEAKEEDSSAKSGSLEVTFVRLDKIRNKRIAVLNVKRSLPRTETARPASIIEQHITLITKDGQEVRAHARVARQVRPDYEVLRVELPSGEFESLRFAQVTEVKSKLFEVKFKDIPLP